MNKTLDQVVLYGYRSSHPGSRALLGPCIWSLLVVLCSQEYGHGEQTMRLWHQRPWTVVFDKAEVVPGSADRVFTGMDMGVPGTDRTQSINVWRDEHGVIHAIGKGTLSDFKAAMAAHGVSATIGHG